MRELKILVVVLFFTAVVYWGVEPFAHSQMHPHVAPADFAFKDLGHAVGKGDFIKGEDLVQANCVACHSVKSVGIQSAMSESDASLAYGVVPPDLSNAGLLYDPAFLSAFLKNPAKAMLVEHKFDQTRTFPMPSYDWMSEDELASILAFFHSIVKPVSDKALYEEACGRCHDMKYDKTMSHSDKAALTAYMGTLPPDLSIMIRAKSDEYLSTFINNPQKQLAGTSMPRVGLTEKAQNQVISYMEKVGDRKKAEREDLGYKLIGYMVLFTLLAFAWKVKIWREVH